MRGPFPSDHLVISAVMHHAGMAPPGWDKLQWVDDEGRPLLESHAPPALQDAAGMDLRPCPFHDSRLRHEKPMNVSALQQVARHWSSTKEIYLGLRALLFGDGAPRLTVRQLWRTSYLAFSVPAYLAVSTRESGPPLPAWAATLFKTGLGLSPLSILVFEALLEGDDDEPADPAHILRVADESGTLIGARHVCAGPPRMILEVIEHVVAPPPAAPVRAFGTLLDEPEGFRRFGLDLLDACVASYLFFLCRQLLAGAMADEVAPIEVEPNVFPYIDVLDEMADTDRAALLEVVADLFDGDGARERGIALAGEWLAPRTDLLDLARRLERRYLDLLGHLEGRLRAAAGLPSLTGRLDAAYVDRLYGDHPRRRLEAGGGR